MRGGRVNSLLTCLALLLASGLASGQAPLFESAETLSITIEAPMRQLIRERRDKPSYPGTISYTDGAGLAQTVPVTVSTRGNARLDTCEFPPLRLEFAPADAAGTVFEGESRLKMVTHCKRGGEAAGWLLLEYGIYRAFNVITDASYRVRRFDVSYQDSESARWTRESPAFVIEDTGAMARRLGMVSRRPPDVETAQYDAVALTNMILFEYLIANTDFAVKRGPEGEGCCHNARLVMPPGQQDGWIVVPYDFDQSGLINTDYALADERLGIRSVTSRLYRGFCWQNDYLPSAIALFNERRDAVVEALLTEGLPKSRVRRTERFVDRFYKIVNDSKELEEQFINKCRGAVSFPVRSTRTKK